MSSFLSEAQSAALASRPLRYRDEFSIQNSETHGMLLRTPQNVAESCFVGLRGLEPVVLTILSATDEAKNEREDIVRVHEPVYLKTVDGLVFQRSRLMYYDQFWRGGRFALGFVAPSESIDAQTCILSFCHNSNNISTLLPGESVFYGKSKVGVSFGGLAEDPSCCNSRLRRYLTIRPSDPPTCVVNELNGHEKLDFCFVRGGPREQNWERRKHFLLFVAQQRYHWIGVSSIPVVLLLRELVYCICAYL
jgi:hypothetical protein